MKTEIITVAGKATRFNRDTDEEVLKCLYYKDRPECSLLYQILQKSEEVERFVIVGGYLYDKLEEYMDTCCDKFKSRVQLVYNDKYDEFGSGYSLIKGIETIDDTDEVIFVEGDLFFDKVSFQKVVDSTRDVITVNRELIHADKAVVLYVDGDDSIHYLYDTRHKLLNIPEPVKAIYNSAQIWKFLDFSRLKNVVSNLTEQQVRGTNLEIVQGYFDNRKSNDVYTCVIEEWGNCNTVADYLKIYSRIKNENHDEHGR